MNQDPNNNWLEDALRRDESYINDDGFAARVVAVLPPPRRKCAWLRPVILGAATAAGVALAFVVLPVPSYLAGSFVELFHARSLSAVPLVPVVLIALFFWATFAAVAREN
jgi:hypothetical protein